MAQPVKNVVANSLIELLLSFPRPGEAMASEHIISLSSCIAFD
jgi:hypothetical protein